jgi:alkanesulfonate monooxygenase SsuD/methylene tetrahydromethanopterin reductase-like flavin-dependent oxidoreductase (luciferase family)
VTADRPPAREVFLVGAHGPQRTVAYAVAAERAGFEGVWLAEHHFGSYGRTPSATVLAGHILGRTRRIAVGTAACVLSARHPVALGEEAVLLDALAPGRFRLGVARGGPWLELEVFGTGLDRYRRGFTEALDLLLRWCSGQERVGAAGEWFRFREVAVVPRPARPVPVWVAATSPPTVDIAAARGLPLLLGVQDDTEAKAAMLARYAQTAAAHGHDPAAVPHASVQLAYAGDPARLRPRLAAWLATTRQYVRLDGTAPQQDPAAYADHLLRIHPVGAPAQCAEKLATAAEAAGAAGIRHLLLMVEAAGPETADQLATLGALMPASASQRGFQGGTELAVGEREPGVGQHGG